uniref:DDE_3 domain-containing protein n=1 Tax=Bursaphelenchus xylophilus TaxID=6326 RepID=A0A1I7RM86_BURXY
MLRVVRHSDVIRASHEVVIPAGPGSLQCAAEICQGDLDRTVLLVKGQNHAVTETNSLEILQPNDTPDGFTHYTYNWHKIRREQRYLSHLNAGGGSLMTWGAFEETGVLSLDSASIQMNRQEYQEVFGKHLVPYWEPGYTLMQDNDRIHLSWSTKQFLEKQKIATLDLAACSFDLNLKDNVWGFLVRELHCKNRQYFTVAELKEALFQFWRNISQKSHQSIPSYLIDVI